MEKGALPMQSLKDDEPVRVEVTSPRIDTKWGGAPAGVAAQAAPQDEPPGMPGVGVRKRVHPAAELNSA